jgi:hypothetical protein
LKIVNLGFSTSSLEIFLLPEGTNQSGASDDTDSENLKLGAFAAKRDILNRKIGTIGRK